MREPAPDHCGSQYDRPNQRWVCGLAREGQSCPPGPTASGDCPARSDCTPLRDGARWQCNRSALRGGVCDSGPTPEGACGIVHHCHPQRSLRAIRGRFVSACALAGGWRSRTSTERQLARPGHRAWSPVSFSRAAVESDRRDRKLCCVPRSCDRRLGLLDGVDRVRAWWQEHAIATLHGMSRQDDRQ